MMIRRMMLGAALALALAAAAQAHEMFLKPQNYFPDAGTETMVTLVNGSFDKSENETTRDRMNDVSVITGGQNTRPAVSQWSDMDKASHLALKVGVTGTYVLGVSTKPNVIELSAKDFDAYLEHDGVEDTLKARQAEPATTAVKERYSKHVRSFLQVGEKRTGDWAAKLGYPVEILPRRNPLDVKAGGDFGFTVIFKDKPAANQLVYASYEGYSGHTVDAGHLQAHVLRTDASGNASFKVTNAGTWYVTLIHMQKVEDGEANYESNWATLTFQVR